MKASSSTILRVGVGITFLWIGILIYRAPDDWAALIQPWAAHLIPGSMRAAMLQTAVLDIVIGLLLVIGMWTWLGALLASLHWIVVLITVGITEITSRDIGLLAASIALMLEYPLSWNWIKNVLVYKRTL
ncbi:DoxX family membrane protein [Candidatus Peregrinibacteria bacterium]|nr:DoxX family membrane protein [Candidatus Peregrinibacteria bacterium]